MCITTSNLSHDERDICPQGDHSRCTGVHPLSPTRLKFLGNSEILRRVLILLDHRCNLVAGHGRARLNLKGVFLPPAVAMRHRSMFLGATSLDYIPKYKEQE
jgi:hypothetical protein